MPRLALLALALLGAAPARAGGPFPDGFLWGTAGAGFQSEAGAGRDADRRSDYWRFMTDPGLIRAGVVSGDRPDAGPGFWRRWRGDLGRARHGAGSNAIRLGIEWSRIFPRSTARVRTGTQVGPRDLRRLDRLADRAALRHYDRILRGARRRGLRVMLTLNHYTLPIWLHDPLAVRAAFAGRAPGDALPRGLRRAGWLQRGTVREFRKFAAYAAWRLGRRVDLWVTLNEPLITVSQGYVSVPGVTGVKPPAILSYRAALRALENLGLANAAAYDAIHAHDRHARVGFAHNMLAWRPSDPTSAADAAAAAHADQLFNRTWLDIALRGDYDVDGDGIRDPEEHRPGLAGRADFVGVNHYSPARARALGAPATPLIPLFDFAPETTFRGHGSPAGPPCPSLCSDFGWEIDPAGLRAVVAEAAGYGRPVYVTENGIDDGADALRPAYIRSYLAALQGAIASGADVRGYFHWTLVDNFEWAEGLDPRFGLYSYDPRTLRRTARPSAGVLAGIAQANAVP